RILSPPTISYHPSSKMALPRDGVWNLKAYTDTGMNIPNKQSPIAYPNLHGDIEASLKAAWLKAGNAIKSQPQLPLCIHPNTGVPSTPRSSV
ncbi:hypothetical protein BG006_005842, partial [Podila minutissima]